MTESCIRCQHYGNRPTAYHIGLCAIKGHLVVANYDGPRCADRIQACDEGGKADPALALDRVDFPGSVSGGVSSPAFSSSGAVAPLESPVYRTPLVQSEG